MTSSINKKIMFIAKDYVQIFGIHYNETFAPMSHYIAFGGYHGHGTRRSQNTYIAYTFSFPSKVNPNIC